MKPQHKIQCGFTLIEILTVIVILSVTSVLGTYSMVKLYETKTHLTEQTHIANKSQLALDRMRKQITKALPFSLRVSNSRACLTFMPVVAQGFYLNPLPDNTNGNAPTGASAPIDVAQFSLDYGVAQFLSIGADNRNQLYGASTASLATIDSIDSNRIRLVNNHRWRNNDPNQRFFIADLPQAFCFVNEELRYYSNLSPRDNRVDLSSRFRILLNGVRPNSHVFELDTSGCVQCLSLRFSSAMSSQDRIITHQLTVPLSYARY